MTRRRKRLALAGLGLALVGAVAAAQEAGKVYTFEDKWFSAQFPEDPKITSGTYSAVTATGGKIDVPATVYAVNQPGADYKVTDASLAGSPAEDRHALEHAAAAFRQREGIALDLPISQSLGMSGSQLCGRQFGYSDKAGRLNYETLFYNRNTNLFYDIHSSVTPDAQAQHGGDVAHFQVSLTLLADPTVKPPLPPEFPANWQGLQPADPAFAIRFPATPALEQVSYRTDGGVSVPASRYWVRKDGTVYRLTAASLWNTTADGADAVDQAVRVWERQGTVVSEDLATIAAGQCGRDVTIRTPQGGLSRALIFFPSSQHRLYIIEVAHEQPADQPPEQPEDDRRFRESFVITKPE